MPQDISALSWTGWTRIDDGVKLSDPTQQVAAVVRMPGRVDLYAITGEGAVVTATTDPGSHWRQLPSLAAFDGVYGPVVAVARSAHHVDVVAVTTLEKTPVVSSWVSGTWQPWSYIADFGGGGGAGFTAVARGGGHVDLFATGPDGYVWTTWSDTPATGPTPWRTWQAVNGNVQQRFDVDTDIRAVAVGSGHLALFAASGGSVFATSWSDPAMGWEPWVWVEDGRTFTDTNNHVAAVARRERIDLFKIGYDNAVWTTSNTSTSPDSEWVEWTRLGDARFSLSCHLAAVARGDRIDLFTINYDGTVWSTRSDLTSGWAAWSEFDPATTFDHTSRLTAVARDAGHVDLATIKGDGTVWKTTGTTTG